MVAPICLLFRKLTILYPFNSPTANSPSLSFDKFKRIHTRNTRNKDGRADDDISASFRRGMQAASWHRDAGASSRYHTFENIEISGHTHDPSRIYLWDLTKDGQDLDGIPKGASRIQEIQDRRSPDAEQSSLAYGSKLLSRRPFLSPRRLSRNLWPAAAFLIFVRSKRETEDLQRVNNSRF